MSADKHRGKGLEIEAAYLSLASGEWGLSVNRSGTHILTPLLKGLARGGLVRMERVGTERSKTSRYRITEAGAQRLADLRRSKGADFGRHSLVGETEYRRHDQTTRRHQKWEMARRWSIHRRDRKARLDVNHASVAIVATQNGGTEK